MTSESVTIAPSDRDDPFDDRQPPRGGGPLATSADVRLRERFGYGLGDTASNLFWKTFEFFLLYFYTDVFGISPANIATLFLVTRMVDAISDPIIGSIADRTSTRWGKFRPYLLWVPIPLALLVMAMFYTPDFGPRGRLFYAYLTYAAVMIAYTAINTPYGALLGVMTSNSQERTRLSTYRFVLAFCGAIVVQYFTLDLVAYFDRAIGPRYGFTATMTVYSVVAVALFWICFATTRERVTPSVVARQTLRDDARDLFRNGPWIVLFFYGLASLCGGFIRNGTIVFFFKYCCDRADIVPQFLVFGSICAIGGMLCTPALSRRLGKKRLLIAASLVDAAAIAAFMLPSTDQIGWLFLLHGISTFSIGPKAVLIWTMYADAADYSFCRTGRRANGLIFSAATFSQKVGCSIGAASTSLLLGYFEYVAPIDGEAVVQSATTVGGLRLMMSVIPACFSILAAGILVIYPIDREMLMSLERQLSDSTGAVSSSDSTSPNLS